MESTEGASEQEVPAAAEPLCNPRLYRYNVHGERCARPLPRPAPFRSGANRACEGVQQLFLSPTAPSRCHCKVGHIEFMSLWSLERGAPQSLLTLSRRPVFRLKNNETVPGFVDREHHVQGEPAHERHFRSTSTVVSGEQRARACCCKHVLSCAPRRACAAKRPLHRRCCALWTSHLHRFYVVLLFLPRPGPERPKYQYQPVVTYGVPMPGTFKTRARDPEACGLSRRVLI